MEKTKDIESALEVLNKPQELRKAINEMLRHRQHLEGRLRIRSVTYADKVQTTRTNLMEDTMAELIDLEKDLQALISEHQKTIYDTYNLLLKLPDDNEQTILIMYYIGGFKMDLIKEKMITSNRKMYYYKNNGIKHFAELLKERQRHG